MCGNRLARRQVAEKLIEAYKKPIETYKKPIEIDKQPIENYKKPIEAYKTPIETYRTLTQTETESETKTYAWTDTQRKLLLERATSRAATFRATTYHYYYGGRVE